MTVLLKKPAAAATPLHVVDRASFDTHLKTAPETTRRWLKATGFDGAADRRDPRNPASRYDACADNAV